jgi:hypothetical protein
MPRRAWAPGAHPMLAERCEYKAPPGNAGECGKLIYWILVPGGFRIVAEITSSEAHAMESRCMDVEQVLSFLGLRWSRSAA